MRFIFSPPNNNEQAIACICFIFEKVTVHKSTEIVLKTLDFQMLENPELMC